MNKKIITKVLSGIVGLAIAVSAMCMPASVSARQLTTVSVAPQMYYSASLSTVQSLKEDITAGFRNFDAEIDISKYKLNINSDMDFFNETFLSAVYENADLFYLSTGYSYSYYSDGTIAAVAPSYSMQKSEYENKKAKFDSEANKLMIGIDGLNDFQKVLTLHDRLAQHITYDLDADNCYDSYGAIAGKRAVCQGYTLAYIYLLKLCGIESVPVSSSSMGHMWNLVKLGGYYYHVDVTWDDESITYGNTAYEITGRVNHKYFLRTDSEFKSVKSEHYGWSTNIVCNSQTYKNLFLRISDSNPTVSQTFCDGDNIYYVKNGSSSSDIVRRTASTGAEKVLYTVKNGQWANSGTRYTIWPSYNAKIAENSGFLYFNECKKLRKINLSNDTVSDVCTLNIANNECTVGLGIIDGKLKYDKQSKSDVVTQLIDSGVNIEVPVVPSTTQPTTIQPTSSAVGTTAPNTPSGDVTTTGIPTSSTITEIFGDATGDGKVTAADVLIIRKKVAGQNVTLNDSLADVNSDGKLTAADVLIIRKYIAGQRVAPWF